MFAVCSINKDLSLSVLILLDVQIFTKFSSSHPKFGQSRALQINRVSTTGLLQRRPFRQCLHPRAPDPTCPELTEAQGFCGYQAACMEAPNTAGISAQSRARKPTFQRHPLPTFNHGCTTSEQRLLSNLRRTPPSSTSIIGARQPLIPCPHSQRWRNPALTRLRSSQRGHLERSSGKWKRQQGHGIFFYVEGKIASVGYCTKALISTSQTECKGCIEAARASLRLRC